MNTQVQWFCHEAVQEGLLDGDVCRELGQQLGEEADLLAFAQAVVDRGLSVDLDRIQAIVDRVATRGNPDEVPPVDIFGEERVAADPPPPVEAAALPEAEAPAMGDAPAEEEWDVDEARPLSLPGLLYVPFSLASLQPILGALIMALVLTVGVPLVLISSQELAAAVVFLAVTMPTALLVFLVRFLERVRPAGDVEATLNSGVRVWLLLALTLFGLALPAGLIFKAVLAFAGGSSPLGYLLMLPGLLVAAVILFILVPSINVKILFASPLPAAEIARRGALMLLPFVLVLVGYFLLCVIGLEVFASGFSLLWSKTRIANAPGASGAYEALTNGLVYLTSLTVSVFFVMAIAIGVFYFIHYALVCLLYGRWPFDRPLRACLAMLPHLAGLLLVTGLVWYLTAWLPWDREARRYDQKRQEYRNLVASVGSAKRQTPPRTVTNSLGQTYVEIPPGILTIADESLDPPSSIGNDRFSSFCYALLRLGRQFTFSRMSGRSQPAQVITGTGEPYALAETEVSQAHWRRVMGYDLGDEYRSELPVQGVTVEQVRQFAARLSAIEGNTCEYALPSRAQWLNAWKQGQSGAGWSRETSGGKVHPVSEGQGDLFGLKNLLGNVPEWCDGRILRRAEFPAHLRYYYAWTVQGQADGQASLVGGGWQEAPFDPLANAFTGAQPRREVPAPFDLAAEGRGLIAPSAEAAPSTPAGFRLCRSTRPPAQTDPRVLYRPVLAAPLMPAASFDGLPPPPSLPGREETIVNAVGGTAGMGKARIVSASWPARTGSVLVVLARVVPSPVAGIAIQPGQPSVWLDWPGDVWPIGIDPTGTRMAACNMKLGQPLEAVDLHDLQQGKIVASVGIAEAGLVIRPFAARHLSADGRFAAFLAMKSSVAAGSGQTGRQRFVFAVVDFRTRSAMTLDLLNDLQLGEWDDRSGSFVSPAGHMLYVVVKDSMVAVDLETRTVTGRLNGFLPRGQADPGSGRNRGAPHFNEYALAELSTDAAGEVLVLTCEPIHDPMRFRDTDPRRQDTRRIEVLRRTATGWETLYSQSRGPAEFPPALAAVSPDGAKLAISSPAGLTVVNLAKGNRETALDGRETGAVGRPVFSPDGSKLATVGNQLLLWYLETMPEFN